MPPWMAVREAMEIAAPADTDTLGSYGQDTCQVAACSSPARYRGRCFKHWREGMAEKEEDSKGEMTDDRQRELIMGCRTRKQACLALGLSPRSLGALDKRCMRLGVKPKWMRVADVEGQPQEEPTTGQPAAVSVATASTAPAWTGEAAWSDGSVASVIAQSIVGVVAQLRALPDDTARHAVLEAATSIAIGVR